MRSCDKNFAQLHQIDNFLVQAYLEDRVDYAKTQKIPEAGQHINYVTIKKG